MRALIVVAALTLAACSPERAQEPAAATATAAAPASAAPERTGRLADPSPMQVAALVGDWTGQPLDIAAAAERAPEYQNAPAAEREAVRSRLVEAERAGFQTAQGVGVLELSAPVNNATYEADKGVYHLPVFLPGSTIAIAPGHRLRLSNAAAAYALGGDGAAAMRSADARPARVRLTARIDEVRATAAGSEVVATLQTFTLYDAAGRALGETVSMRAAG
jgi:hypothetical protein